MRHVLLRAVKDAFEVVPPETALLRNTIAGNAGNLIFSAASQRILTTAATDVTADRFVIKPGDAERINERYDAYVLPLANAFRLGYEPMLVRLTALIRRLRIPVVVLGVGSQAGVDNDTSRLAPIAPAVRDFVGAVLDRGPSIGVRGELTHEYLTGLGFRDVEVIGCPSLFMGGDRLSIRPGPASLTTESRLAINVSPYLARMGPIVADHVARYPDLTYIPQDIDTLELLLWGEPVADVSRTTRARSTRPIPSSATTRSASSSTRRPGSTSWPPVTSRSGHASTGPSRRSSPAPRPSSSPTTRERSSWPATSRSPIACCGTSIRPRSMRRTCTPRPTSGRWSTGMRRATHRFVGFLDRHGLDHVFRSPAPEPDFAARVAATSWPDAVTVASRTRPHGLRGELKRSRRRVSASPAAPRPARPDGPGARRGSPPGLTRPRGNQRGRVRRQRPWPDGALVATAPGPVGPLRPSHPVDREWPTGGSRQGGCAMRKPRLALAALALVVVGCSGGTASSPGPGQGARPPDPQHHVPSPNRGRRCRPRPRTAG